MALCDGTAVKQLLQQCEVYVISKQGGVWTEVDLSYCVIYKEEIYIKTNDRYCCLYP